MPESHTRYGRSLEWIAPELSGAGLAMIEDHADDARPWRSWAGTVDAVTFQRFARAWHLGREADEAPGDGLPPHRHSATHTCTLDGMNWEPGGDSPVVFARVHIEPAP